MTELGSERTPDQPGEPFTAQPSTPDGLSNQAVQTTTMRRPGLITFAAVMMFILGGFHVLLSISEFANSTWVLSRLDIELFIPSLILWGIIDLVIGFFAMYAGASILRGEAFGWLMGYTFATLGIIRWLFYIPASPVLAVVIIVLDILVILWAYKARVLFTRRLSYPRFRRERYPRKAGTTPTVPPPTWALGA